jgi:hypothetical protein
MYQLRMGGINWMSDDCWICSMERCRCGLGKLKKRCLPKNKDGASGREGRSRTKQCKKGRNSKQTGVSVLQTLQTFEEA